MPKNIVVFSGGLDSTSVLALARHENPSTIAVGFDYGQSHVRELEAAKLITEKLHVPFSRISLKGLLHGSALLGEFELPEGHYSDSTMSKTVVSGRNLLFASAAVSAAQPGDQVWLGVHAGDHPVYADCRPEFWEGLRTLVRDAYGIEIRTPFLNVDKAEGLRQGAAVGAPYADSWSCYAGGDVHCGRCGTCVERAEAFYLAGIDDPTAYADSQFWKDSVAQS